MKTKLQLLFIFTTILCLFQPFNQAFGQYQIKKSVFGSGGTTTQNSEFQINGTLSQPSIGQTENNTNYTSIGFWYRIAFTINATSGPGGYIEPAGDITVYEGDNQKFTFTSNAGYQVDNILIDGFNNLEAVSSGAYTFLNIGQNHRIEATFKALESVPPFYDKLVLWLNPASLNVLQDGEVVTKWNDEAANPYAENAEISEINRRPVYRKNCINSRPAVQFEFDYEATHYGYSDILTAAYHPEITSGWDDKFSPQDDPNRKSKALFIIFKTGSDVDGDCSEDEPDPYYADGRQTIFEAGGPLSGFNIYISQGKLVFGMWNRFEKKFVLLDGDSYLYPLDKNSIYIAELEFNANAGDEKFRAILCKFNPNNNENPVFAVSPYLSFKGLTKDEDKTGIGGGARTCYHDFNTGESYSDHFGGLLGDILLYNYYFDNKAEKVQDVYSFIGGKYGFNINYPLIKQSGEDNWQVYESTRLSEALGLAYPNPFSEQTRFTVDIPHGGLIKAELLDNLGRRLRDIFEGVLSEGMHDLLIDGSGLANGMYIIHVYGNDFELRGKVILNK